MKLQVLSDLHLESEVFEPVPADGAEALVLAGDIDSRWHGLERFAGWPVPVVFVAGNHEFDRRDLGEAWGGLRERCERLGLTMLERESRVLTGRDGRRIRFVGTIRWSDFDLFGPAGRAKAERAAAHFLKVMGARRGGRPFDAAALREEALACRTWLAAELARPAEDAWEATVVVTHYAPSARSADPRYGTQPSTASFCNADDDLLPQADLWLHGHLHHRCDWQAERPGGGTTRVRCHARGLAKKGEPAGYAPLALFEA